MPPRRKPVPSYLHHKPSGQAYTRSRRADGSRQVVSLGEYDSEESRQEHARILSDDEPPAAPNTTNPSVAPSGLLSVAELVLRFMEHAEVHYRRRDGTQTHEVANYRASLRPLNVLFRALPVTEFGPKCLKKVREALEAVAYPADSFRSRISKANDALEAIGVPRRLRCVPKPSRVVKRAA